MYENFLPRTPEDDARDALQRAIAFQRSSSGASMRQGESFVQVHSPPTDRIDIEEKVRKVIIRGRLAETTACRLRAIELKERTARKKAKGDHEKV
jgi:hypothetical protein